MTANLVPDGVTCKLYLPWRGDSSFFVGFPSLSKQVQRLWGTLTERMQQATTRKTYITLSISPYEPVWYLWQVAHTFPNRSLRCRVSGPQEDEKHQKVKKNKTTKHCSNLLPSSLHRLQHLHPSRAVGFNSKHSIQRMQDDTNWFYTRIAGRVQRPTLSKWWNRTQ